jgi:hypothetical protein
MAESQCPFCKKSAAEERDRVGKTFHKDGVMVHQYCLYFAAGLHQRGEESEGVQGFLLSDIRKEVIRASKLVRAQTYKKIKENVLILDVQVLPSERSGHWVRGQVMSSDVPPAVWDGERLSVATPRSLRGLLPRSQTKAEYSTGGSCTPQEPNMPRLSLGDRQEPARPVQHARLSCLRNRYPQKLCPAAGVAGGPRFLQLLHVQQQRALSPGDARNGSRNSGI